MFCRWFMRCRRFTNDLIYWQSVFHGDGSSAAANVTRSDMTEEVKHSVSFSRSIRYDTMQLNLPNGTKQKITIKKTKTN